jgi:hypothetical protein
VVDMGNDGEVADVGKFSHGARYIGLPERRKARLFT